MSTPNSTPDLTQRPPRSPRVRLGGYVLLPRILDKGRATLAGKLGEYHYGGKSMDRHFFNFTGLDDESLKAEIAKGGGDGELLAWVNANAKLPRQPWEIAAWSDFHAHRTAMPKRSLISPRPWASFPGPAKTSTPGSTCLISTTTAPSAAKREGETGRAGLA
jgi:hypothetical protein